MNGLGAIATAVVLAVVDDEVPRSLVSRGGIPLLVSLL